MTKTGDSQHRAHAPLVLVTGASGNVGGEVVRVLRAHGVPVRAAGRANGSAGRDDPGLERVALDFRDPTTFAAAIDGCAAVFLMRPPPIADMRPTLNAFLDVARARGVQHVVFLSVAGAERNRFVPHHDVEVHLAAGAPGWTVLRPGFFAQNLADAYRRDIVEDGRIYVPAGHGTAAFIDGRDIAEVAALALTDPKAHAGQAYTLTGPEALSFDHVAASLTRALGQPIRYVPASMAGYAVHLHRRGLRAAQIAVQTILHVGLRFGRAAVVDPTLERLLGRPGYTLDAYVKDHVAIWR